MPACDLRCIIQVVNMMSECWLSLRYSVARDQIRHVVIKDLWREIHLIDGTIYTEYAQCVNNIMLLVIRENSSACANTTYMYNVVYIII